ncbi:MAG TPA: DNA alkylation repair protein [Acidobacteriota bacterium]|nr:DNA alkylation repair protein [Acidobacteriota bacterium]
MSEENKLEVIFNGIRAFCEANADEALVQKYSRYFTEGYDAYGLSKEVFLAQASDLAIELREKLTLEESLRLGDLLFASGKYEEASFALRITKAYESEFSPATFQHIGEWFEEGVRNWGHTDVLCGEVLSIFFKKGICGLDDLATWRDSSSKWRRRAVPVSMIEFLDSELEMTSLLEFIDPMMMDEERFVHQGLGWFLREAWKRQPQPVESFLLKWKDTAPRKIFQYATEKMTKEQKTRFRAKRRTKK